MATLETFKDEGLRRSMLDRDRIPPPSERQAAETYRRIIGDAFEMKDWLHPDYAAAVKHRQATIKRVRAEPKAIPALKQYYKLHPDDFINDWGVTTDPRNLERSLPTKTPFILFDHQHDWVDYVMRKWRAQQPGLTEKSRDCGISWLSVALGCTLCLHYHGMNIGYGSRLREYVDKRGFPKALFWKARKFMDELPPEFNGGWNPQRDAPLMRLSFPATESSMTGEGGDNIGRGDRASIYFVDEHAHLEQGELVDVALSQTTNCQMDISSVNGMQNTFAQKRHSGKVEVFIFDWRDDPRKDDAWYQKQQDELTEVAVAQEVDRNYNASVEGILIPNAWIRNAVDAHKKLKVVPTGRKTGALDVADEGKDLNAFAGGTGILIDVLEEWSGRGGDIYATVERAFNLCDENQFPGFKYDADGLGAGVRGDARIINKKRRNRTLQVLPFRGSAKVYLPEKEDEPKVKNKDMFQNCKAQSWWNLRRLFRNTHRAVADGLPFDPDEIISISSDCPNYLKLVTELSQPTYQKNTAGKIVIDKVPDGARSPNLADAVMIRFSKIAVPLAITEEVLAKTAGHSFPVGVLRPQASGRAYGSRLRRG